LPRSAVRIQRKLRRASGQRFRRTAHASRLTPKATLRIAPVLNVTLQSPTSPAAKSRFYQIFQATIVRSCLVAGWKTTRFFNNGRQCVAPRIGKRRRLRVPACEECGAKAGSVRRARTGARWQIHFCHDLDNIYQIDLDGNVLKKWELSKILTDASMNGGDRLSVSPDGKTLLMDVDCGSEHERKTGMVRSPRLKNSISALTRRCALREKIIMIGNHFG
jgi:hypothetical protein